MTVYLVYAYGRINGVYATRESAEKAAAEATLAAEMNGSHASYCVIEMIVKD